MEVEKKHLQFKHPFNAIVSGPSQCGKTTFVRNLLKNHSNVINGIKKDIITVAWAYGKWQPTYSKSLRNVNFRYIEGIPDEEDVKDCDIIVLDDLMSDIDKSQYILNLFVAGTHHDNISVIVLTQNFYHKSEIFKELRLNSHYIVLFKNPGDKLQVQMIGRRMYPECPKFFISAFEQASEGSHGYMLIDRHQTTPESIRLRTDIIPSEKTNNKFEPKAFVKK